MAAAGKDGGTKTMRTRPWGRGQDVAVAALLMAATAAIFAWGGGPPAAYADDAGAATASGASGVTGPACLLKGTFPGPKGVEIFDAPAAGRAVAAFTGAWQPMTLADFPADPSAGRARIRTTLGSGSFRVEGWVAPSAIAVFTTRDVPVYPGHVWISEAQRVKLVQAASGSLGVELRAAGGQTVRATAPCDALGLQQGTPAAMEVPGNGRGYLSKGSAVELFDEPGGAVLLALKVVEGAAQLFWSTESRAGFVHVKARGNLTVDAWARASSLDPLKKGEMMDQLIPPTTAVAGARFSLDKPPRLVQATREIPLRARREDTERPIGAVEVGAEIYVLETLLGWTNVLPKNLGLAPAEGGGFWIPSSEAAKSAQGDP
jgi:hypothetical protein